MAYDPATKQSLLEKLTQQWQEVKAQEVAANRRRIEIESEIYAILAKDLPEKGTFALDSGMKIVTGFTEEWDQERLAEVQARWTAELPFPFTTVYKPIAREVAYLREKMPELYSKIGDALTLKPKKPAFSVKEGV